MHKLPIYEIFIDGKPRKIELARTGESSFTVKIDDKALNIDLQAEKLDLEKGFSIKIGDKTYKIELPEITRERRFPVMVEEATFKAEVKIPMRRPASATFEPTRVTPVRRGRVPRQVVEGAVTAPMTGKILSVAVKKGDEVKAGQVLCVLEAMKMENEITASRAGTVREVHVSEGSPVSEGEVLFIVT